ncbi:MAG: M20 family metallo-hydrolase [Spirochaetes bacterium]|nr:M20 family metallo-hydrolase [Spirochaetota bacterium]
MKEIFKYIESQEKLVIEIQKQLTKIPAIAPESGGQGEYKKYLYLKNLISDWGFDSIETIDVYDDRVESKTRPSLIASINGKTKTNFWIITHTDVVPPGESTLWETSPFDATVKNGKIYGRGTEDNQQSLVSSLLAAKSLFDNKIIPYYNVKLLFVADEEVGSKYGIEWILKNKNIFNKNDLILVPDGGNSEGNTIEIAEKSILWISFSISGKQSHGSRPDLGINTARASSYLCVKMDNLYNKFDKIDNMYDVPYSTFEPTRRYNNIENINTIPGSEILCYDCRILPDYKLDDIISQIELIKKEIEKKFKVKIEIEIKIKLQAPIPTPTDAQIVQKLKKSVKKILNIDAKPIGIGGGTVAAYFRMKGFHAALWSTIDMKMHGPNEYSKIINTINDAKVFFDLMTESD